MKGPIVIADYDPAWPVTFAALGATLREILGELALAIEHVGSTAVPGLAAKPVIDIDAVVPAAQVPAAVARLAAAGYEHRGDCGVPQREAFRRPPGSPPHHLYVCPPGSAALANHLAIRDHLRAHPAEARAYGDLKRHLAAAFAGDSEGYVQAKTDFLVGILQRRGFAETELAAIERMNRRP